IVGAMMFRNVQRIGWDDPTEGIPAFMAMIGIPLTYSISSGLALGFISYPLVKVISGRGREVSWVIYAVAVILIVRYMFVKM
ncbi:MAG TPA: NCS2 family permease, partial [Candidatus Sumerlaeota bacterium]|nr:NCS2 family permease [Candidatus Sumerlaeota bacterium]